jgi:hypothetical protein
MEIVYLPKRPLNLRLQKFAELDTQQTLMGIACTPNKPLHQLHIHAPLDLLLMVMELAFKRELLIKLLLIKCVDLDIQVTETEIVSQSIHKLHHQLLIILVKLVIFLTEMGDVY